MQHERIPRRHGYDPLQKVECNSRTHVGNHSSMGSTYRYSKRIASGTIDKIPDCLKPGEFGMSGIHGVFKTWNPTKFGFDPHTFLMSIVDHGLSLCHVLLVGQGGTIKHDCLHTGSNCLLAVLNGLAVIMLNEDRDPIRFSTHPQHVHKQV